MALDRSIQRVDHRLVLSGYPATSSIDRHETDMAMLDPVIDGWVASRSGGPALGNAIITITGKQFRRPPIQPEELRRSRSGRGMHCVQSQ